MKHMVVDTGEDEEFTDEDVYGLSDEGSERKSRQDENDESIKDFEILHQYRRYIQTSKAEEYIVVIDRLQEFHSLLL